MYIFKPPGMWYYMYEENGLVMAKFSRKQSGEEGFFLCFLFQLCFHICFQTSFSIVVTAPCNCLMISFATAGTYVYNIQVS
jgi:hypothetical protein